MAQIRVCLQVDVLSAAPTSKRSVAVAPAAASPAGAGAAAPSPAVADHAPQGAASGELPLKLEDISHVSLLRVRASA